MRSKTWMAATATGALLLAAGTVVWSASRTTGLVIQPFTVPPELVEDGLDGRAVAALFQDELVRLEAATVSPRAPASFRNDWSGAITVEVVRGRCQRISRSRRGSLASPRRTLWWRRSAIHLP